MGTTFNPEQPASTTVTPYFSTSIGTGGGGVVPSVNGFRSLGLAAAVSSKSAFAPAFDDEVLVMVAVTITAAATAGTKTMRVVLTWTDPHGTANTLGIPVIQMGSSSGALDMDTSVTGNVFCGFAYVIIGAQQTLSVSTTLGSGSNPVYDLSVKTFQI